MVFIYCKKGLLTLKHLTGSHHLHIDPETSESVAKEVAKFLLKSEE